MGYNFFFFLKLGQQCFSLLCGPAVKEFITLSLPLFFFFFIQEESESMCVCVCVYVCEVGEEQSGRAINFV